MGSPPARSGGLARSRRRPRGGARGPALRAPPGLPDTLGPRPKPPVPSPLGCSFRRLGGPRRNLSAIQDREICCYSISCKEKDNIGGCWGREREGEGAGGEAPGSPGGTGGRKAPPCVHWCAVLGEPPGDPSLSEQV